MSHGARFNSEALVNKLIEATVYGVYKGVRANKNVY